MNAKNYSNQLAEEMNLKDYLTEQWQNYEQVYIRKVMGFSSKNLGYKLKMPIIGKILYNKLENMIHSEKKNRQGVRADGHFGQVIPLEDGKIILSELAAEPIICNYCMCRWQRRGVKEAVCINFGVLSEVIEKLPRFIPKDRPVRLDREAAVKQLEENNKKGYIASVWFQPVPYINAICSCENPECGAFTLRNSFDFNLMYKAEYIINLNQDNCQGCRSCVSWCQMDALKYIPSMKRVIVVHDKCVGCGVCRHVCENDALNLIPREEFPGYNGKY
jgi:NAD-dependent dihydropyrimidine dehydrogenase PreA subunit